MFFVVIFLHLKWRHAAQWKTLAKKNIGRIIFKIYCFKQSRKENVIQVSCGGKKIRDFIFKQHRPQP